MITRMVQMVDIDKTMVYYHILMIVLLNTYHSHSQAIKFLLFDQVTM